MILFFVQEHWLMKSELTKFDDISSNFAFYGASSMNYIREKGLIRGRPFGGVGVLYRKNLGLQIGLSGCMSEGRAVAVVVKCGTLHILGFSVYLPYEDHSKEYLSTV